MILNLPFFAPHHLPLAAKARAWAQGQPPHLERDIDASCRLLAAAMPDLLQIAVPPTGAFDVRSLCLIRESLAFHSGLADFAFAMQGLGSAAITLFGTDSQKARTLPPIRAGQHLAAFALSEAEAGSDVASLATTATLEADHYVLNGEKTWISNGGIAHTYIVFARTNEAPGTKGLSAFIVPADAPGFSIAGRIEVAAPHPLATIRFENCRIPAANLIGEPGQGFRIAMSVLDVFRATVGAAALGFARRALHEAITHAKGRHLFGAPLADMPVTQAAIADMAIEVDAAALLVYRAAWVKDSGAPRVTRESSMAKLYATEAASRVIDRATQLHGGLGVTKGHIMEQLTRDVRALRIYEGATEVQRVIIARQVLGDA